MDSNHKSLLMEEAALRRGLQCHRMSYYIIAVDIGSRKIPFLQFNGPSASTSAKYICDHKHLAKDFLSKAHLPINPGKDFPVDDEDQIASFATSFPGPTVIKPSSLSKARGVSLNVTTLEDALRAQARIKGLYTEMFGAPSEISRILVEKQFEGSDIYRFFVVGEAVVSIIRQSPAQVRGDGRLSIRELIGEKNRDRASSPYFRERLVPESMDGLSALVRSRRSLDDIPEPEELVILQDEINVGQGGENVDVTELVHGSYRDLAVRAIQAIPGMHYGGVDMFIRDYTSSRGPGNCAVSEVEFSPGPTGLFPNVGTPRDIAGAILEFYIKSDF